MRNSRATNVFKMLEAGDDPVRIEQNTTRTCTSSVSGGADFCFIKLQAYNETIKGTAKCVPFLFLCYSGFLVFRFILAPWRPAARASPALR